MGEHGPLPGENRVRSGLRVIGRVALIPRGSHARTSPGGWPGVPDGYVLVAIHAMHGTRLVLRTMHAHDDMGTVATAGVAFEGTLRQWAVLSWCRYRRRVLCAGSVPESSGAPAHLDRGFCMGG